MSLAIYLFGVFVVVTVMLSGYFLGERGTGRGRSYPYESGIESYGSSRVHFFSHYFLLAVLFVIFDIESVFLYLWSSSVRETSWLGFFQVLFFIAMLLVALIYAIRSGVLNLVPRPRKRGFSEIH